MSVLIKGMKMPDSCHVCVAGYGGCCFVAPPDSDGVCPDHGRADFCPLIELPPHGRLIDADALMKLEVIPSDNWVFRAVEKAPTIIPADPTQSNASNTLNALTNADRIRAMTDEEMVNQFTETMGFCCPVKGVDCSLEPDCRVCFDRWLKQEVTE